MTHKIIAIAMAHRSENAEAFQRTLTDFGCKLKARIGLHEAGDVCSEEGLIILQIVPDENTDDLLESLNNIQGVRAKYLEV